MPERYTVEKQPKVDPEGAFVRFEDYERTRVALDELETKHANLIESERRARTRVEELEGRIEEAKKYIAGLNARTTEQVKHAIDTCNAAVARAREIAKENGALREALKRAQA